MTVRFDIAELQTGADRIRQVLMERIYQSDLPPGAEFSESELARAAEASTVSVREFLIGLLHNRFAHSIYDIVSLVFHYHYQWGKGEERARNQYAVHEHLEILRALARRDVAGAIEAMRIHLNSSRSTLLQAIRMREQAAHSS